MPNVLVEESSLEAIAEAIRNKLSVSTTYKPSEMAGAIETIKGGGSSTLGTKFITENGTYEANDDNLDGYSEVIVNVSGGGITPTGTKQISISQNGTTIEDVTNYASAKIAVNVSGGIDVNGIADCSEPSGAIVLNTATEVKANAFYARNNITAVSSDSVVKLSGSCFRNCIGLVSVSFPNVTTFADDSIFYGCSSLVNVSFPKLSATVVNFSFRNCSSLVTVVLPNVSGFNSQVFDGCTRLETLDVGGSSGGNIGHGQFTNNSALNKLILRSATRKNLINVNAFNGTPFANGGTGGTIYIPKSLYDHLGDGSSDDYQSAKNWSTIHGYGTITWAKIEGTQYENYYADGTAIVL